MSLHIDGVIFSLQRHGGISVYFRELAAYLQSQREPYTLSIETPPRQEVETLAGAAGRLDLRPGRRLERIRRCRPVAGATLFHSSYYRLPAQRGVTSVVTVYDFLHERFPPGIVRRAQSLQKRAAIKSAQAVICISEATRQEMLHWVGDTPGQAVHVIHCGVADTFRPLPDAPAPERPFVLFVGERGGYKNFAALLAAMRHLPGMELHCVGGGALRPDEFGGVDDSVRTRVRHLGFVTDEALNATYNAATCLAYPSAYEGFGIPVAEAMRAGCPVVATDCKAVVETGGAALTVADDASGEAIARAIEQVASPARRATVVETGYQVARRYDWRLTHLRTLEVYRSLGLRPAGDMPLPSERAAVATATP